jgi:hypothetical protein
MFLNVVKDTYKKISIAYPQNSRDLGEWGVPHFTV